MVVALAEHWTTVKGIISSLSVDKMGLATLSRSILLRTRMEPVTTILKRNLGVSCMSRYPGGKQLECAVMKTSAVSSSLLLPNVCRSHTRVLFDTRNLRQNLTTFSQDHSKVLNQRQGVRLQSYLKCSAVDYHTSRSSRQVVSDEDDASSTNGGWVKRHRAQLRGAPLPALILGFSGLVPFLAPAAYNIVTLGCGPNAAFAQVAYGACILSFLGGVRWGVAITPSEESPSWSNLGISVLPSLIAWMGLMMPLQPGLFCIISGLALAGGLDSRFGAFPPWFRSLRLFLTTLAILSISVTFGFSILFPPPEPEHGYNFRKLIKIAQIIVSD